MSKHLDLDEMLSGNEPIFVRNNMLKSHILMVVEMKDKHGRGKALKVLPTALPVEVTAEFPRDVIRDSTDFRRCIKQGNLVLVDPVEARKQLSTKEAKEELKALNMSVYADSAPANAVRDSMSKLKGKAEDSGIVDAGKVLASKPPEDGVQHRIKGLIVSFQTKEKSSKETLTQLRRLQPTLSEQDLTYVLAECKDETTLREFAEKALAQLANPSSEEVSE
jgi:hypothetical protein